MLPTISYTLQPEDFKNLLATTIREELKTLEISKQDNDGKLLTRKEVAELFGITLTTLNTWCKEKRIVFKKVKSRVYFLKADVHAALESKPKYKRN